MDISSELHSTSRLRNPYRCQNAGRRDLEKRKIIAKESAELISEFCANPITTSFLSNLSCQPASFLSTHLNRKGHLKVSFSVGGATFFDMAPQAEGVAESGSHIPPEDRGACTPGAGRGHIRCRRISDFFERDGVFNLVIFLNV